MSAPQGGSEGLLGYVDPIVKHRVLRRIVTCLYDFRVAESVGSSPHRAPIHVRCFHDSESRFHRGYGKRGVGQGELDDVIKTPKQSAIEQADVIRGRKKHALRFVLFEEL